jgi:ABC-type nitrate/sulfonate/bicarbonate transport system substrate-binding protein
MRRSLPLRALALLVALASLAGVAGCGSSASSASGHARSVKPVTLMLDFTPNAIHSGIYSALAHGYDRQAGIALHVQVPSATTDSIKLLEAGRVDFALLDIHDLAIARERGADLVGIMAVVERPLAAVIAQPSVSSPRSLAGRTVGVTGVPSDTAVLRSVVAGAGGDPARVHTLTIGFDAVAALLSRRVAAATAFWNDEGVTLQRKRPGFHVFRVDDFGAPSYPELVLCTTRTLLRSDAAAARGLVRALVRGYALTRRDPAASAADLEHAVPGLDPHLVAAELHAEEPAFLSRASGRFGVLEAATLRAWNRWEVRFGVISRPLDLARAFQPLAGS